MSRHSSFSRSSAPRPWRSVSKPVNPSVSLVFAEPEQAVMQEGSATAMLTPQQHTGERSGEPGLFHDSPTRRLERPDAVSSLRRASYASLGKAERDSTPNDLGSVDMVESMNGNTSKEGATSSSPESSSHSAQLVPVSPARSQTPQTTGWFVSLGRKSQVSSEKTKEERVDASGSGAAGTGSSGEPSRVEPSVEITVQQPTSLALDQNTQASQMPLEVPFPASTPPSEPKVEPSSSGRWFSNRVASLSLHVLATKPTPNDTASSSEIVQSSEVTQPSETLHPPSLPENDIQDSSPPRDIPQARSTSWFGSTVSTSAMRPALTQGSVDDKVPTLSSFTTTSSSPPAAAQVRPRERTNSNLSSLNPSSSRFTLSMPLLGRPKIPLSQAAVQAERAAATNELSQEVGPAFSSSTRDQERDSISTNRADTPSETSSWWGYVGLASSNSLVLPLSSTAESTSRPPVAIETVHTEPVSSPLPPTPPEASVRSAETNQTQASTWYTPWRWYTSTTISSSVPSEPPVEGRGKTQAEMVKEEALARSESPASPALSQVEPSNSVLLDPESRASWVSFFSSRSVSNTNVKPVKEQGEVMEVMNVDEEDEEIPRAGAVPNKGSPLPLQKPKPEQESPKNSPTVPLTKDEALKRQASRRTASPSSKRSIPPVTPRAPNLVLPTFEDTFGTPPRSIPIPKSSSTIRRTIRFVSEMLFPEMEPRNWKRKEGDRVDEVMGRELPRTWSVLGDTENAALGGLKTTAMRAVVLGIHGWFPGSMIRQILGEPTGTSEKFASMMATAVEEYFAKHGGTLEKLTNIALEGEGTIEQRVNNLYQEYLNHEEWVEDLHKADVILVATHSQGSIVSTHLLERLIREGHIRTHNSTEPTASAPASGPGGPHPPISVTPPQRVCCLAMCGIHLGPLLYLNTSSLVNPYLQYFESAAARELFEFQDSESRVSQAYVKSLSYVLDHGTKFTYIASMNDQVVPIYSGSFTTAAHPLILRALYIDGDAYSSSDFLSNLLVLLCRIRNAGLDDGGLITHLSEATAGSLSGVGHSSAYEELATYRLAVRFLFETSGALGVHPGLKVEPFTARAARNDYEIPWALRSLVADPDVAALFTSEFLELRAAFDDWHPRTTVLRDIRRKLEPIRRLPTPRL